MKGLLLEKSDKIDTKSIMAFYSNLEKKYKHEGGITKENLCSFVMSIFSEVNKYKKLTEDERKEIIIAIANKFIRTLEEGDVDSDIEILLMSLVPNLVDSVFFTIRSSKMLKKFLCCGKVE